MNDLGSTKDSAVDGQDDGQESGTGMDMDRSSSVFSADVFHDGGLSDDSVADGRSSDDGVVRGAAARGVVRGADSLLDVLKETFGRTLPWSYRQSYPVRLLIAAAAGVLVGFIGTLAYRCGVPRSVPYGLVLAFVMVILSAFGARARSGVIGLAVHLITSSLVVSLLSSGVNGNVLVPGFTVEMPFLTEYAGYIWFLGMIVVQVAMVFLPARWFGARNDGVYGKKTSEVAEGDAHDGKSPDSWRYSELRECADPAAGASSFGAVRAQGGPSCRAVGGSMARPSSSAAADRRDR
ncbi:hypothetical protein [Bifidobacterium bombi]|uniref:Alcohol dehydrogenase, class IV n=1 Tax=Bifidobacterium bombi DSM 19703 TaxID=1341695 RepID=A0A080N2Y4_9BIFI|nr:hypothetical protein [Bifidobacterium bombi]KFF31412.1 hypothetical protein BBOMB_0765 [Bifidobacterium bombi DSM 19703]